MPGLLHRVQDRLRRNVRYAGRRMATVLIRNARVDGIMQTMTRPTRNTHGIRMEGCGIDPVLCDVLGRRMTHHDNLGHFLEGGSPRHPGIGGNNAIAR